MPSFLSSESNQIKKKNKEDNTQEIVSTALLIEVGFGMLEDLIEEFVGEF